MASKYVFTFLSVFLLLCGAYSSFAQEGKQYQIALFPCGGEYYDSLEQQITRTLQTNIQTDRSSTLVYSHYDNQLNEPRIKSPNRLWVGGEIRKRPDLDLVYALARERGFDGVVMCWGKVGPTSWTTRRPHPVWVYLIDVAQRKVYSQKGTSKEKEVKKITNQVFADFVKGRPTVVQAKTAETMQPESLTGGDQQTDHFTPYRIGLFPVSGKMSRQLARSLVASFKKNPTLVFTYSYYNDALNEPRIKNRDRLWAGSEVEKKPNLELVYALARERELDGVIMMSGKGVDASFGKANLQKPITFYLIDVAQHKVYRGQVTKEAQVERIAKRIVGDFVKGRPKVVQAKTSETPQTVVAKGAPTPIISTPGGIELARGTLVPVELIENINTTYTNTRELVYLSVTADVKVSDKVAIPRGALVKAKIGAIKKHKTLGRAGDLSFHPVAVAALDGQWVSLVQEDFGAEGAGPSFGALYWIGVFAKGRAAFVLRGTQYEVIVERDAVIDTGKRKPLASLRKADFQTTPGFGQSNSQSNSLKVNQGAISCWISP